MTDSQAELDRRLRRLEDRLELSDLVAKYGIYVDDHDLANLAELYADDAVFDGHALGTSRGKEAVLDYFRTRWADYGVGFHYTHTQTVDFQSEDEATGCVTGHVELSYRGTAMRGAYRYDDEYVRERGRWRFRERMVKFFYMMPMEDLSRHFDHPLRRRWPDSPPTAAELPETTEAHRRWTSQDRST